MPQDIKKAGHSGSHDEALLDFALQQSPCVYYVAEIGGDLPIRYVSPNLEAVADCAVTAFLAHGKHGKSALPWIHDADRAAVQAARLDVIANGAAVVEYRFRRRGGDYIWLRDQMRLVDGPDGAGRQVLGSLIDVSESKRAEAAQTALSDMFEDAIESIPNGFGIFDAAQRLTRCNTAYAALYDAAPGDLVGKTWTELHERAVQDVVAIDGRPLDGTVGPRANIADQVQAAIDTPVEVQLNDGRWFQISGHRTADGGTVFVRSDITDLKTREAELRQAHETLEDAVESLSEGLALYDADDRLVMCNKNYREFNQISADLLVPGTRWEDITRARAARGQFPNAEGRLDAWMRDNIAERGQVTNNEFPQSDGRWFEHSHRYTRQGGLVITWRDVTERKAMERALRDGEAMVRRVLEACPLPIGMTRASDGVIIYESPASRALFGRTGVPGAGPGPSQYAPPAPDSVWQNYVYPSDREHYLAVLREKGAVEGFELLLQKADGTRFWAALYSRLIDYQGEEVIVSTIFDLTERRAMEEEMARQRDALHQSEKLSALGELLAGVAHELNNPLSVVVGQALLLKETTTEQRAAERAEKIGNAADRCARIVKTFLAMARQEPGRSAAVDLNEIIEATLEVLDYSLRASDIEIELELAAGLPSVLADADQVSRVITNLLVNAQHALQEVDPPRKLRIVTGYRRQRDHVVLKIKDNGPGIPGHISSRIFEPLFTTKSGRVGTGMGLAVCHRIIEAHGGTIEVESAAGEGAAFAIRLPTSAPCMAAAAPENGEAPRLGGKLAALVVDDEPDVSRMLSDILHADGHEVTIAGSGQEALKSIEEQDFDVILSDLRMPQLDGPSLYQALEARDPALLARVAFITGDTMSPKARRFLEASGRPYLEKPISLKDVRNLVHSLSQGSRGDGR